MLKLISAFLAFSMIGQMPLVALASEEADYFPPYTKPANTQTWQEKVDEETAETLANIDMWQINQPQTQWPAMKSSANAPYDQTPLAAPEIQWRGAWWLDHKSMLTLNWNTPVDPDSLVSKIELILDGRKIPLRIATEKDLQFFQAQANPFEPNSIFITVNNLEPLPANKSGVFQVFAGLKSKDGKRESSKDFEQPFVTEESSLTFSGADATASPGQPWYVSFRAPTLTENLKYRTRDWPMIDGARAKKSMVVVDPPVNNLKIYTYSRGLFLKGDTVPNTTYNVTLKAGLPGFGSSLESDTTFTVKVGDNQNARFLGDDNADGIVLPDKNGNLIYPIYSTGLKHIHAELHPFNDVPNMIDEKVLWKSSFTVAPASFVQKTDLDLTSLYKQGVKAGLLLIRSDEVKGSRSSISRRIQFTNLTATALTHNDRRIFFANDRHTGAFLKDATFHEINPNLEQVNIGNDMAVVPAAPRNRFQTQSKPVSSPCAPNLAISPAITQPLTQGDQTQLNLKIAEPGKLQPADSTIWFFHLRPTDFSPPGWSTFHFGGDNRKHSRCTERKRLGHDDSFTSRSNEDGHSTVAYRVKNMRVPEPLLMEVTALRTAEYANREQIRITDIFHPADVTVGVKANLLKASQGYDLKVKSIACDLLGKQADSPYRLTLKKTYGDQVIDTVDIASGKAVKESTFHVASGEPVILIAEITDSKGRLSRTTYHTSMEYCREQNETQPRLGLVTDKEHYRPGETVNLWITAPFAGSEGLVTVATTNSFEKIDCKFDGQTGFIQIPTKNNMTGPLDLLVKLYKTAETNHIDEAPTAEGLVNLLVDDNPRSGDVVIKHQGDALKAGEHSLFSVNVLDENGLPKQNCEVIFYTRKALRLADTNQTPVDGHINAITELSLDHQQAPKAADVLKNYLDRLPIGSITSVCSLRHTPPQFEPITYAHPGQGDTTSNVMTARTDKDGVATFEFVVPPEWRADAANIVASVKSPDLEGTTTINLPLSSDSRKISNATVSELPPATAETKAYFGGTINGAKNKNYVKNQSQSMESAQQRMAASLFREGLRLASFEPETLDSRAARAIVLSALNKAISPVPLNDTKSDFETKIADDSKKVLDNASCLNNWPQSWIEGLRGSTEEPLLQRGLVVLALAANESDKYTQEELDRRIQNYAFVDFTNNYRKPISNKDYDTVLAFYAYCLAQVPHLNQEYQNSESTLDQIVQKTTENGHYAAISTPGLCYLILATRGKEKYQPLLSKMMAELLARKDRFEYQCSDGEKTLLRMTPLTMKAALLMVLADSKDAKLKIEAANLSKELSTAVQNNSVLADIDLALIVPALLRYTGITAERPIKIDAKTAQYLPQAMPTVAINQGISVKRVFESAMKKAQITQSADGIWHCKKGDIVRQVITFAPTQHVDYLIVHDHFAPGLATSKSALPVASEFNRPDARQGPKKTEDWCEYNELNGTSLTAYGTDFDTRRFIYDYTLTAVKPGTYKVPATEIRDPYNRQFFGTSGADTLVVE